MLVFIIFLSLQQSIFRITFINMRQFIKVTSVADNGNQKTEYINRQQIVSLNTSERFLTMSNGEQYRIPKKLLASVINELNIFNDFESCQK